MNLRSTCLIALRLVAATSLVAAPRDIVRAAEALPPAAQVKVDYARDIQPLLAQRCYECHGADKQKNGLRLDRKPDALKGGETGVAIIPGKSQESRLIHSVAGTNPDLVMPQKGPRLTSDQIGLLRAWIDQGAAWPETGLAAAKPHWAFVPPVRPVLPAVKSKKWIRNPVDNFVLARLDQEGLAPSPEADRVTLIRRLSLDLTGLPPSPQEVDYFVADKSRHAYAELVERLLASPHYGERWGRHWLDAARYADSNGFEKDRTRSIWPYRDWVIKAFNQDLRFDQFTLEQLAGDLLPNATLDQRIATGFLRNSMVNQEGGIEPEKFRTDIMVDRLDAVGRTWLGLTLACAQCHSHKYDPISQKEYYQVWAFLNNDDEPRLEVPTPEQAGKRAEIQARVRALEDRVRAETPGFKERFAAWEQNLAAAAGHWTPVDSVEWHSTPMKFEKQEDLSFLGGGDVQPEGVIRIWWETTVTNITGFRLEAMNNANLPFNGPGLDGNGTFQLAEFLAEVTPLNDRSKTNKVVFKRALADAEAAGFSITNAIDGNITTGGWANDFTAGRRNQERRAVFEPAEPISVAGGARIRFTLPQTPQNSKLSSRMMGRFRLSYTTDPTPLRVDPLSEAQRQLLALPASRRTPAQERELFQAFLFSEPTLAAFARQWDDLWKDWPTAETTLGLTSRWRPRSTHIFKRGDYLKPQAEVSADVPEVLNPFPADQPRNRIGFARWLVDRRNPLTARVLMNRVWQHYFGQGLVITPEDFGTRADKPSHPELLDWLATEFMSQGWSLKAMHRQIVTSATYRQSSRVSPALYEKDPFNRLLARGPRFRVDAEVVQDIALKAAGLLSPKIGGPSVFPPLPDGVMQFSFGPIPWNVSEGDDRYRRAMYTFWKRSVPFPVMSVFDAPAAEQSCVRRTRSNTPLQALTTLNEPTFNNAARWLAWRALNEGGLTTESRLSYAFRLCVARQPEPQELQALQKLLVSSQTEFSAQPKEALIYAFADPKNPAPLPTGVTSAQLAAWTAVSRAILNLDETFTRE